MRRWVVLCSVTAIITAVVFARVGSAEPMVVVRNIEYATVDGVELSLDVYRPGEGTSHPAVIAIHGGSWRSGDKTVWRRSASAFVEAGFVVFAVEYRLVPPGGTAGPGDAPRDVARAIAWVKRHALEFSADPDNLMLVGSSAGAHLALLVGQRHTDGTVRAVATWSPPVNLVALAKGPLRSAVRGYVGCSLRRCPHRYRRLSPLHHVAGSDPPAFLANSTDEVIPLRQVRSISTRLTEAGVENALVTVPGTAHGQGLRVTVVEDTISFLRQHATPDALRTSARLP